MMVEKFIHNLLRNKEEKYFRSLAIGIKLGKSFILKRSDTSYLKIGNHVDLRNFVSIWIGKNANLELGENVFMNNSCSINCMKSIEIGDHTLFGEGVKIYDHNHQYAYENGKLNVSRKEFTYGNVKIGKNCWLGSNVVVLKGVTIGDNSIIGAGCVIHKDIPKNSVIVNHQELISK